MSFQRSDYAKSIGNMEKYFLHHGWSDGLPLVPPTREAVDEMLEGTDLPLTMLLVWLNREGRGYY